MNIPHVSDRSDMSFDMRTVTNTSSISLPLLTFAFLLSLSVAIDLTALSSFCLRGLGRKFFGTGTIDDRCMMPLAHWILGVAKQFSALVLGFPLFLPSEPIRQLRNQFWKSALVHSCSYRRTLTHPANLPPARPPQHYLAEIFLPRC